MTRTACMVVFAGKGPASVRLAGVVPSATVLLITCVAFQHRYDLFQCSVGLREVLCAGICVRFGGCALPARACMYEHSSSTIATL